MSRLDSFLRRLTAQRDCLNLAARLIDGLAGPVLELGLGNGRTYDHLRSVLSGRDIFVFDRHVDAHPDCVPDAAHMILGDFLETLPAAAARIGGRAALAHCDTGSGDAEASRRQAGRLAPLVDALMAPGGVVVSDQPMAVSRWRPLPLPDGVKPGRYHLWRVGD
jgi:hypothetical protein